MDNTMGSQKDTIFKNMSEDTFTFLKIIQSDYFSFSSVLLLFLYLIFSEVSVLF